MKTGQASEVVTPITWLERVPEDWVVLICYLRPARNKARLVALSEVLCLLNDLGAAAPVGGPLSEQGGLFWVALPADAWPDARLRLPRLGYANAVDLLEAADGQAEDEEPDEGAARLVRWRRRPYRLVRAYEEDAEALRESAPDRRTFLLETHAGEVRPIKGYRGDGGPLSRRGLPVYDARLLVNLVHHAGAAKLLDPFAGVGGVVLEAKAAGYEVWSLDNDPALRPGLSNLGAAHTVGDAARLPFGDGFFDAVATEPPYDPQAEPVVVAALAESCRVIREGGRLAVLCAAGQAEALRRKAATLPFRLYLDSPINRKGLDVVILAWRKGSED